MTMRIRLFADQLSVKSDDQSSIQSGDSSGANRVKFLYSYGGRILPRPADRKLRYVGGETRVMAADRNVTLADLSRRWLRAWVRAWCSSAGCLPKTWMLWSPLNPTKIWTAFWRNMKGSGPNRASPKCGPFCSPNPQSLRWRPVTGLPKAAGMDNIIITVQSDMQMKTQWLTIRPQQNSVRRARTVHSRNSYQYPSPPPPPPPSAQMPLTGKATKDPQQHRKPAAYHNILRSPYPGVAFRPHDQLLAVQQ